MSMKPHKLPIAVALLGCFLIAGIALSLTWSTGAGEAPAAVREITLHARDMAYYLPGETTPNPTLRVTPGETVRFILVNQDKGMQHDLIAGGGEVVPLLEGQRSASARWTAPRQPGELDYLCTLHPAMMRGKIAIR